MTLIGPILDDRTYAQLKDELVKRIPVYAPEWTDHNESDPGIALLELFAHLGESLLFRFNQIPDATKVAFLRLLGVQPRPAQCARTLLALSTERPEGLQVLRGKVARAGSVGFQTEDEVYAWPMETLAVRKRAVDPPGTDAAGRAEQRRLDDAVARLPESSRRRAQQVGSQYFEVETLGPDPMAVDAVPLDISAAVDHTLWVALLAASDQLREPLVASLAGRTVFLGVAFTEAVNPYPFVLQPVAQAGSTSPSAPLRADSLVIDPPPVLWELWNGTVGPAASAQTGATAAVPQFTTLTVLGDSTRGLTTTGVLKLELPPKLPRQDPAGQPSGDWETPPPIDEPKTAARIVGWLRARRPVGSRDSIHLVRWVGVNVVPLVQSETASPELLGSGTGDPGQMYRLTRPSVLPQTTQLEVEEVDGWHPWTEVDSFSASGALDLHYTVDYQSGVVTFGSGARGRIPQLGQRIRVVSYQVGGGVAGNVPAGAISVLTDAAGAKVSNPLPAAGGADPVSLAAALDEIPASVQRHDRAVTVDDFSALAREVAGVKRADTLPLLHPDSPRQPAAGVLSVVVFPTEDQRNPSAPEPDLALLRRVAAYLNDRRLVTAELYLIPPTYRRIAVSVGVQVRQGYQVDAVRRWVEQILRQYLAPLPDFGPEGAGWPLGRAVRRAELEAIAVQVDGVEFLAADLLLAEWDDTAAQWTARDRQVALNAWEVPELASITVVQGPPPPAGQGYQPPAPGTNPPVLVPVPPEVC
jgi:predicted phage baseplate assembly protein